MSPIWRCEKIIQAPPKELRDNYRGFGDMDATEIAKIAGLALDVAGLAAQRSFSEPGLWSGDAADLDAFLRYLMQHGVKAHEGGQFLTLPFGQTKADQMTNLIAQMNPRHTVALGDAPNNVEMLQATDFGIVVADLNPDPLPMLRGEASGQIIRTDAAGPVGWNKAVVDLIARLDMKLGKT